MTDRTCAVEGCDKSPRSATAELCKMHYHRWYRHGDVRKVATKRKTGQQRRYVVEHNPQHPIAPPSGKIWVHRRVLYDTIGAGPHPCHWCGLSLQWRHEQRELSIHVDHLDGQTDNNEVSNLVVSCPSCNTARGVRSRHEALVADGWWSHHDTIRRAS